MDLESFNKLTDEEKNAFFTSTADNEKIIKDRDAEIASLKTENESLQNSLNKSEKELSDTKQLNYTMARKLDSGSERKSFEETLHEALVKGDKR